MSRYIDADSFIDYLGFENTEEAREEIYGEIVTLSDFDNQPTADVEEVKHGQWIEASAKSKVGKKCSNCFARIRYSEYYNETHLYCHKCGAKMDL